MAGHESGKIQTVRGPIDPADLGTTLMHEHILCDVTPPGQFAPGTPEVAISLQNVWEIRYHWCRHRGNGRLDDPNLAIQELERLTLAGGMSVVEVSSIGMQRDPMGLRKIAETADLNIIMGCGYYVEGTYSCEMGSASAEEVAEEMIAEICEGVGETGIRAGIIGEIGCSGPWTPGEKRNLRAAVQAQQSTGAALSIHPARHPKAPLEAVDFVRQCGGDPERTIVGHIDRTIFDKDDLLELARTGCVIEYDFFGIESSYYPFKDIDLPTDAQRLNYIRFLIDKGFGAQLVLSHDICTKTRLANFGGHGYDHLMHNVVPMMRRKGFGEAEIHQLFTENPRRLLTLP